MSDTNQTAGGAKREIELLCDLIIPGDDIYPAPSEIALPSRLSADKRFGPTADAVLSLLPKRLAGLPLNQRTAAVRAVEAAHPLVFRSLIIAIYSLYYSDPTVLRTLESEFGYSARPPQPFGYEIEPFDPVLLAIPRSRPRQYRLVERRANEGQVLSDQQTLPDASGR
jgi:hypothetical protein